MDHAYEGTGRWPRLHRVSTNSKRLQVSLRISRKGSTRAELGKALLDVAGPLGNVCRSDTSKW